MKILKKHLYWFEPRHRGLRLDHQMPCFFHETSDGYFYGFPEIDEQGVKLAMHSGGQEISEPSQRDHETVDKGEEFEPCLSYASRFVPMMPSRLFSRHQVSRQNWRVRSENGRWRSIEDSQPFPRVFRVHR